MLYKRKHDYEHNENEPKPRINQGYKRQNSLCENCFFWILFILALFILFNINWSSMKGMALSTPTFIGPPTGSRHG